MGTRIHLKALWKYKVFHYLVFAILLFALNYFAITYFYGTASMRTITQWGDFLFLSLISTSIVFWLYLYSKDLQRVIYSSKTNGRNLDRDKGQYKRSFWELLLYFKDADTNQINPNNLEINSWNNSEGIMLGKISTPKGLRLIKRDTGSQGNVALFALPGAGKTVGPITCSALRFGGSMGLEGSCLVIDIKGDILSVTKDKRALIKVFDPTNENGCHYNPFEGIENMNITERKMLVESMANAIVPDQGGSDSKYFTDGARDYFCGIALHLLHEDNKTTFPQIVDAILSGNAINWVMTAIKGDCVESKEFLANKYGSNEKNLSGCYSCLAGFIRPFSSGALHTLLDGKGDCITPSSLEEGDVYIEIPQDKIQLFAPITTIIIQNFMTAFMQRKDYGATGQKPRPIVILLDEFPVYSFDYNSISTALATLRSKGITCFLCMQSIAQLKQRYGDKGTQAILDCCGIISVMSAQDPESRLFFQKMAGTKKVLKISNTLDNNKHTSKTVSEDREYIFQPEDFGNLGEHIVVFDNGKYIIADKIHYWD